MNYEFSDTRGFHTTVKPDLESARDYAKRMVACGSSSHVDIYRQEAIADIARVFPDLTVLNYRIRLNFVERVK